MHSLFVLENRCGFCFTVSVLRSLCYGLCVTVYFLVLFSSLSLYAVILACHSRCIVVCHRTLYVYLCTIVDNNLSMLMLKQNNRYLHTFTCLDLRISRTR